MSARNDIIARAAIQLIQAIRHREATDPNLRIQWHHAAAQADAAEAALNRLVPPTSTDLSVDDMALIHHALGYDTCKPRSGGYRNYYAPGAPIDITRCERLAARGYLQQGSPYHASHYYHVTEAGAVAAGCRAAWRRHERDA